jgi:hypothetical protein
MSVNETKCDLPALQTEEKKLTEANKLLWYRKHPLTLLNHLNLGSSNVEKQTVTF